jgi:hypothetical protein
MTAAQDTVAATAAWLDGLASGAAEQSNWLAGVAAGAAQTAAALRAIVWDAPPLPTLTLAGPGDITPSTTAETDASATLTLSAPSDQPVEADWTLDGAQADDFLGDTHGHVVVPAGDPSAPIPLRVAPLTLTADRAPVSLALANIAGALPPFPPALSFSLLKNSTVLPGGGPAALDPASFAHQAQADPSTFSRVTNALKPNTAVLLAPGHYSFTSIHTPDVLLYAARPGTVFVDNRVELHTADTAVLGLEIAGGLVLDGARTRGSRCRVRGSDGVDLVSAQGADNILDWCEIFDFAGIGVGVQAKTCRRPVMFGLHVHSQRPSGPAHSGTVFMIGHDHTDSGQPVQGHYERILMEGSRSHDGFEVKSSDNLVVDVTAIGCDVMQRHGLRAATFVSCWAEPKGGQGGRIQLNANRPKAIRCHGLLAVAAGNGSEKDVIDKSGGQSIYPYADGAEVHHHDGVVEIGNLFSASRKMPPVGTRLDACPNVKKTAGTFAAATPIPPDKLPPPARRLTPADVGPAA